VRDLRASGTTILLTTHDMDEAQVLADRVVVLAAGRVAAEGTPSSIGGRDTALARITFALPPSAAISDLPAGAAPDGNGGFVVETSKPTDALHRLTTWAVQRGIELDGLAVDRPSLEDVYLKLTTDAALPRVPEGSRR
jgi:ABC-2 type transport system ATP-binding protein